MYLSSSARIYKELIFTFLVSMFLKNWSVQTEVRLKRERVKKRVVCLLRTFINTGHTPLFFSDSHYGNSHSRTCERCDPSCGECAGRSEDDCLSCAAGLLYLRKEGRCFPSCPRGYHSDAERDTCETCHASCRTCSGTDLLQESSNASFQFNPVLVTVTVVFVQLREPGHVTPATLDTSCQTACVSQCAVKASTLCSRWVHFLFGNYPLCFLQSKWGNQVVLPPSE